MNEEIQLLMPFLTLIGIGFIIFTASLFLRALSYTLSKLLIPLYRIYKQQPKKIEIKVKEMKT